MDALLWVLFLSLSSKPTSGLQPPQDSWNTPSTDRTLPSSQQLLARDSHLGPNSNSDGHVGEACPTLASCKLHQDLGVGLSPLRIREK